MFKRDLKLKLDKNKNTSSKRHNGFMSLSSRGMAIIGLKKKERLMNSEGNKA